MVTETFTPITQEAEPGQLRQVRGQSGLYNEFLASQGYIVPVSENSNNKEFCNQNRPKQNTQPAKEAELPN